MRFGHASFILTILKLEHSTYCSSLRLVVTLQASPYPRHYSRFVHNCITDIKPQLDIPIENRVLCATHTSACILRCRWLWFAAEAYEHGCDIEFLSTCVNYIVSELFECFQLYVSPHQHFHTIVITDFINRYPELMNDEVLNNEVQIIVSLKQGIRSIQQQLFELLHDSPNNSLLWDSVLSVCFDTASKVHSGWNFVVRLLNCFVGMQKSMEPQAEAIDKLWATIKAALTKTFKLCDTEL